MRLQVREAKALCERLGLNCIEQRGFYSHFLRVRKGVTTLATPDLVNNQTVSRRSIIKAWLASAQS